MLSDARADLIDERIDVAFRGGELQDSEFISRQILSAGSEAMVASPTYIAARGAPETLQDLATHDCVSFSHASGQSIWSLTGADGVEEVVQVAARFSGNTAQVLRKAMFNQLSGINALLYYAPRIFELGGAGLSSAMLQSVALGGTNLAFTIVALFLIDRIGRKPLLYGGSVVTAVALFIVAAQLDAPQPNPTLLLFGLLGFIAAFAISQGAVIWVFISEVFPSTVRGKGQALGSATHWIMAAAITWMFPVFATSVGGSVFAFFGAMMLLQIVFVWKLMPETNGIPLEDMDLSVSKGKQSGNTPRVELA